ncbi:hypothetical protein [Rathayibacter sp. SD072]|uniref:hypothetical protein n=1 Tax=Rathayibacter sp. SD072 TaxID=2781731 RepID=UPI001A96DD36|nr:hypothetical protein [Rathayibacter sp. SD072]MBO0983935.1 hypothetical protein [Rathayibacter sp. SD072]
MNISSHSASVVVLDDRGVSRAILPIKSGGISLDERTSPFVGATVVVPLPSPVVRARLDPRTLTRVMITLTTTFQGPLPIAALSGRYADKALRKVSGDYAGQYVESISDSLIQDWNGQPIPDRYLSMELYLQEAEADYAADELTLTLTNAERLLEQDAASGEAPYYPGAVSLRSIVQHVLRSMVAPDAILALGPDAIVEAEASEWKPGVTGWDYLQPMVEAAGLRLWCDLDNLWNLEEATPSNSTFSFSTANTIELKETVSRMELWADAVLVIYEWDDASGTRQTRTDYAKAVPNPTKLKTYRRNAPLSISGAAKTLLKYVNTRGQEIDLSAVSDIRVAPGAKASITLPGGTTFDKIVAAVRFDLATDRMAVTCRDRLARGEDS